MKTKRRGYQGWRRTTPVSRVQDLFFAAFGRTPSQLYELLESDARMQAARYEQLQQAVLLPLRVPEPVLVPAVDDGPVIEAPLEPEPPVANEYMQASAGASEEPSSPSESPRTLSENAALPAAAAADPRQKYGSMVNSSRVRRRVML